MPIFKKQTYLTCLLAILPEGLTLLTEIDLSLTTFLVSPESSGNRLRLDQDVSAEKLLPRFNQTGDGRIPTFRLKNLKCHPLFENTNRILI